MGPHTWFPRLCQRKTDDPTTVTELGDPCGSASMGRRHEIESTPPGSEYHNWVTVSLRSRRRMLLVPKASEKTTP